MKNCVSINLKKNEILIKISDDAEQKEIINNLNKKLPELDFIQPSSELRFLDFVDTSIFNYATTVKK